MKKSRSLSSHQYSSLVISSKMAQYREKFNQSQQKFNEKYTRNISSSSTKKISYIRTAAQTQPNQTPVKRRPSSGIKENMQTQKQILNILIDLSELNPERKSTLMDMKGSILLRELDGKTKEMTEYADENTALLAKKDNLEKRIQQMKKSIALEKKRLSEVNYSCGQLQNNIDLTEERYRQKSQMARQLAKTIYETQTDCAELRRKIAQNQAESTYNKKHIELLENHVDQLSLSVSNTNISLIKENTERLSTKEKLSLELKVMENGVFMYRKLVDQRQHLQTNIDAAFASNKIENPKQSSKSRLSVNSNNKK